MMMRWSRTECPAYQRPKPPNSAWSRARSAFTARTSATIEKRSLSPCLVVGELKVTFLKCFDFSRAVIRSDAERAWPSSVSLSPRRFRPVR